LAFLGYLALGWSFVVCFGSLLLSIIGHTAHYSAVLAWHLDAIRVVYFLIRTIHPQGQPLRPKRIQYPNGCPKGAQKPT
jgi:hypothetical protein